MNASAFSESRVFVRSRLALMMRGEQVNEGEAWSFAQSMNLVAERPRFSFLYICFLAIANSIYYAQPGPNNVLYRMFCR